MEKLCLIVQIVDRKSEEQRIAQIVVLHKVVLVQKVLVPHNKCTSQHVTNMMMESAYCFAVV